MDPIINKICDATEEKVLKHLRRPKPHIEELERARKKLKAKADDINHNIRIAELEGGIPTSQAQQWLTDAKKVEDKAAAIEQDFESRHSLYGWSLNSFSVNRRVAKTMDDIHELMTTNITDPVTTKKLPPSVVEIPTSIPTLGIDAYMSEILSYIANSSPNAVEVIGIYGMGGVGKTTLLRNINNHKDVTKFDHVIWVVASRECKMERLQRDIANRLELHLKQDSSEEDHANKLCSHLKNKNCLLLLDDLWVSLDLAKLGMGHASSGQEEQKRKVVVFTTRDEQVCSSMNAHREMKIKCLESKEAWELFRSKANDAIGTDVGIERIAYQIAEECAGLPFALITVGMAMSRKKSWEAWNNALTLMKRSHMAKVTGMEQRMYSAFELSYKSLEDDNMRGCLLSCAMWPEDHLIDKEKLIECWMGLGLIDEVGAIHKAYNRGHSHIETLKAACLLESGYDEKKTIKMHDVIRDMALWMASHCGKKKFKWIVRARVATSQELEKVGWHEAERVSLMYNDISSLPNQLSTCSKLSVLMVQCNEELKEIRGTLLQAMHSLMYLDLENTSITEIPKEIGMLSQLQHLNLSKTKIRELPTEFGCLIKLNYLLLRDTFNLVTVAEGSISCLSSLKFLDLRGSIYDDWLDELEGLKGCPSIGINIWTESTLQRLCSLPHVLIWWLNVRDFYDSNNPEQLMDDIFKSHNTRQSMERLQIGGALMDKLLITNGNEGAGGLKCLKYLRLLDLYELEQITWKGALPQIVFPNLRELNISACYILKNVNWVFQLPSLIVLNIDYCFTMVELISDEGSSRSMSFGLRKMTLCHILELKRISCKPFSFPYLEEIEVQNCPFLEFPFDSVNRLKAIRCEQKWWDNLKWVDESIKNSLSPLVTFGKDLLPLEIVQNPTSHSAVGIEECMNMILGYIDSANAVEIIGVYGISGVGKTTLLRRINNHRYVTKFDHVICATVSKECKMKMLQSDIADRLRLSPSKDDTERDHTSKLFDYLENKVCLLLLDGLQEPLDLTKLGMARATLGQRKQKRKVVVFTTHDEQVCNNMNASTKMEIKCLKLEQGWELFRSKANDAIQCDAEIEPIAHEIAQVCAGLPLALVTVSVAMSKNKSCEAWSDALTMMKKEEDPMLAAFKLSYNSLEDDNIRGCLLSCALWPEDHLIDKERLIECWMGLGLINEVGAIHKAYNRGHSHIETLKAACLLEPGYDEEGKVKMHNVIREMALWMAKRKFKWIVRSGVAVSQEVEEEGWLEVERASLMYNDITSLPNQLSNCSKLSVLMLQCNEELEEICGTLIQAMCSLTYLDLEDTCIWEIPKEIGMLSQLRHLNLSRTKITKLPVELGCLVKLNNLFLRKMCYLETIAKGAISNLSSLRFLDLRGSKYKDWLDEVENLKECQEYYSIGIDIRTAAALQRLHSLAHVLIWRLNIISFRDSANSKQLFHDIMKSCNTRQSMEQLTITNLKINKLLISEWNEEAGGLECLKYLNLSHHYELEEIIWKGVLPQMVFPNLCELNISNCTNLRNMNWVLQLPSLSVLRVSSSDMEEIISDEGRDMVEMISGEGSDMEEIISDEGSSSPLNFGLTKMVLYNLFKLREISRIPLCFPYLEEIEVEDCPMFTKLPFENLISVPSLKVIRCQTDWWDDIEWEDICVREALLPLIRPVKL